MKITIIVNNANGSTSEYNVRSMKQAYKIYDAAIAAGLYVEKFESASGMDYRDINQPAIIIG